MRIEQPGIDTFVGLRDTPDSFLGQEDKLIDVNSGATALEFFDASGIFLELNQPNPQTIIGDIILDDGSGASPSITFINEADQQGVLLLDASGDLQITAGGGEVNFDNENIITTGTCDLGNTTVDSLTSTGNINLATNSIVMTGDISDTTDRVDNLYCTTLYPTKLGEELNANSYKITSLATPTAGTDATNKSYVDGLISGLAWQDSILKFAAVGDAIQATGNRYIANVTGGGWTENNIYEWSGSAWTETVAANNMALKNIDDSKFYTYNGTTTEWADIGSAFDHNSLVGLQGGEAVQYYHATEAEHNNWFIKNVDDTDDITEGSTNLFYTDNKVNSIIQSASSNYTIQGDWTYNNLITCAITPTGDNHLARKKYVDDLLSGFTWQAPVIDKDLSTPPGAPTLGDRYIVAGTASNWYSVNWDYRQKITIDNTKVEDDETDFPVYIDITDQANTLFDNCLASGYDILFTTDDGITKIPHEIEYIKTTTTKQLVAWVKRNLSGSSDTEIYMYYGNALSGNQQEVTDTWDSNYKMVQHLGEESGAFYDSTSNSSDGIGAGGVTYRATGKDGYAVGFDGSNDYIKVNNNFLPTPSALTVSAWIKKEAGGSNYETALHKASASSVGSSDYWIGVNDTDYLTATIGANQSGIGWAAGRTTTLAVYGTWYLMTATWDGSVVKVYINGVFNKQYALTSYGNLTTPTRFGSSADGTNYQFSGTVDEVRVSDSARSADRIKTSYNNQDDPSTFLTYGSEESPAASGDWAGHVNDVTEWDAVQWTFQTPANGWAIIVTDESKQYTWNGIAWVAGTATVAHNDTSGKQGGTTDQYYHLNLSEHTELTQWTDSVVLSTDGSMNIGTGDFATTGDITSVENITASGIVQTEMVLANGSGSHPSGIGAYLEMYVLSGTTCRMLPYDGSSYYDLAIGDWNGGDPNIMLKVGGAVGIGEGSPSAKLHVGGDFIATEAYLGNATTNFTIDTVVDPGDLTGTFNQLTSYSNSGVNNLIYMPQGFYIEGTNPAGYLDWEGDGSFYVSSNISDIATYSSDPVGAGKTYANAAMIVKSNRTGTIDSYATGQSEMNAVHYFGLNVDATYSGTEDMSISNIPLVAELIVAPIINDATSDFVFYSIGQLISVEDKTPAETCNNLYMLIVGQKISIESVDATRTANLLGAVGLQISDWDLRAGDQTNAYGIVDETGYDWKLGNTEQYIQFNVNTTKIGSDNGGDLDVYFDNNFNFRNSTADSDVTLQFIGTSNTGSLSWMEDENYFLFDDNLRITTGVNNTYLETSEIDLDLTGISAGHVYIPLLIGKASSPVIPIPYAIGTYDRFAIFDYSDTDTCNLLFGKTDFSSTGEIVCDLANFYFTADLDWNPSDDDSYDLGSSDLRWKDASFSGNIYFADINSYITDDGTNLKIVTNDDLKVDCGSEKTVELVQAVWKDINLGSAQLSRPTSSQPDIDTFDDETGTDTGITTLAFDVGEKVHGSFELQHDYKEGSDFTFHVHFQGKTAPTGTDKVKWQLTYTLAQMGATLDATTPITAECDFDTQYESIICSFTAITGTNFNIGDQFLFTLERIAASANEYAGDALLETTGIHYQVDTIGSRLISSK